VFESKEHAEQAIAEQDGTLWMTDRIRVNYAKSEKQKKEFEIIITPLPVTFTEEQIRTIFSQVRDTTYLTPITYFLVLVWNNSWHSTCESLIVFIPRLLSEVSDHRAMPSRYFSLL
jgi:hypothetical protein